MNPITPGKIRNIAIIAHVDHGKTTLVDAFLKQTHVFRENESAMQDIRIMDRNDLEKERGITIKSKNAAVTYKDYKINIIDTPGHSDFSGEVERVLNMADGCLLLVDAQEGPMPQTKFVLKKALGLGLRPIVVINKIDKKFANVKEVLGRTYDLFLELATDEAQLEFPVFYAIAKEGKVWTEVPTTPFEDTPGSLEPLFEGIIEHIPAPVAEIDKPLQLLVSNIEGDEHIGLLVVGKIYRGIVKQNQNVTLIHENEKGEIKNESFKITKVFINKGLTREEVTESIGGDIVSLSGIKNAKISDTIADAQAPEALPRISIEEPSMRIRIGANTSPLAGQEGKYVTSRQIQERLIRELNTNVSLRLEIADSGDCILSGRGELHLSIVLETMRREGYEMEVGRPEAVIKNIDGVDNEPLEELLMYVPSDYVGAVTSEVNDRGASMVDMFNEGNGQTKLTYNILTRNLIGLRAILLTLTKGTAILNTSFLKFVPKGKSLPQKRNGVLIANDSGQAVAYSMRDAQAKAQLFINESDKVYAGEIIGLRGRSGDLSMNICEQKAKTNFRMSFSVKGDGLEPAIEMSLEKSLTFIEPDELLEVTPKSIRLRKKYLDKNERVRHGRQEFKDIES